MSSDPGWSNDWWGRDPIENAGRKAMTFLARDNTGLIVFEAVNEWDAKAICFQEGWQFIGEGEDE